MGCNKITITGDLGSGKSTITKVISEKIGFRIYTTGSVQREIAEKYKMTTLELNEYSKSHREIDSEIDNYTISLNQINDPFIIDSRMAWFFIANSFKIYLTVDSEIASKRVFNDQTRKSEFYVSIEKAKNELTMRKLYEIERFKSLYDTDISDINNYDLIIDTSYAMPSVISDLIINIYNKWVQGVKFQKYWVNPMILYPTQSIVKFGREALEYSNDLEYKEDIHAYPIKTLKYQGLLYIYDGHSRVSSAILNNVDMMPIEIIKKEYEEIIPGLTVEDFVRNEFKLSWAYDWEEYHGFRFNIYPTLKG